MGFICRLRIMLGEWVNLKCALSTWWCVEETCCSIPSSIQLTFNNNVCQGYGQMTNTHSSCPFQSSVHTKTVLEKLDFFKRLGKMHLKNRHFVFICISGMSSWLLCSMWSTAALRLWIPFTAFFGLSCFIWNIYLVTSILFCFWYWIGKCCFPTGNALVNEKQMVVWEVQNSLTSPDGFLGINRGFYLKSGYFWVNW